MPILGMKHFLFLPHAAIFVEMAESWKQGTWLSPERQQNFLESPHIIAFSKYLRKLSSKARDFQGLSLEWWMCCLVLFTFWVQFDFENGWEIHCQMLLQRTRLREKSNGRNWRDSKEKGLPLYHMQIKSWMMSNPSILLKSIYLAARIFCKSLMMSRAVQKFMILWRCLWWNLSSMRIVHASWNFLDGYWREAILPALVPMWRLCWSLQTSCSPTFF